MGSCDLINALALSGIIFTVLRPWLIVHKNGDEFFFRPGFCKISSLMHQNVRKYKFTKNLVFVHKNENANRCLFSEIFSSYKMPEFVRLCFCIR